MDYKTYNYRTLEENIKSEKEAVKISNVTFEPSVIMERCDSLMATFSELYLDTKEARDDLKFEMEHRPEMVLALFNSIWTQMKDVNAMLLECQNYTVKQSSTSKPVDSQYAVSGNFIIKTA